MNAPKLFLKIVGGLPVDHPAFEDNLIDAFGEIPPEWEPFERKPSPDRNNPNLVLLHLEPAYRKIDGVWQDYWYYREKTEEELAAEENAIFEGLRAQWAQRPYAHNFTAWVLDEQTLRFKPPIPRPTDGKFYRWSGPDNNWKEAEPFPQDGKQYYFDFDNWVNVEITDNV